MKRTLKTKEHTRRTRSNKFPALWFRVYRSDGRRDTNWSRPVPTTPCILPKKPSYRPPAYTHTQVFSLSLSPLIYQHTASGLKRGEPANGRTATPSVVALFQRETGFFFLLSPFWQVKALGELSFSFSSSRQTSQHAPPVFCLALCCVHRPGKWTLWARWRKREEGGLFFSLFTTVFFFSCNGVRGGWAFPFALFAIASLCTTQWRRQRGKYTMHYAADPNTHTQ